MKKIVEKAWLIPLGNVNGVLLEGDDGELVLIDAGFPEHETAVFDALCTLGRRPEDLSHIVFTHAHPDHIGSASAMHFQAAAFGHGRAIPHDAMPRVQKGWGPPESPSLASVTATTGGPAQNAAPEL